MSYGKGGKSPKQANTNAGVATVDQGTRGVGHIRKAANGGASRNARRKQRRGQRRGSRR